MSKKHPQQFLTKFLNAVPDVPEREAIRKLRVERFLAIDAVQFQTVFVHEVMELCNQLEGLALALDNMEETLSACRASREGRANKAQNGTKGSGVQSAGRNRPSCTPVARGEPDAN